MGDHVSHLKRMAALYCVFVATANVECEYSFNVMVSGDSESP